MLCHITRGLSQKSVRALTYKGRLSLFYTVASSGFQIDGFGKYFWPPRDLKILGQIF